MKHGVFAPLTVDLKPVGAEASESKKLTSLSKRSVGDYLMGLDSGCLWLDSSPAHFFGISKEQQLGGLSESKALELWMRVKNEDLVAPGNERRKYWDKFVGFTVEAFEEDSFERFSRNQANLKTLALAGLVEVSARIERLDDGTADGRNGIRFEPRSKRRRQLRTPASPLANNT